MEVPGKIFITDRYNVLELLGQGSMGQVLKCKDTKLGRIVAVKRILKDLDNDSIARFHNEAKLTSQLEHPNIMKIYDFGQADDGQLFMVMDYLDGSSLRELIGTVGSIGFRDAYPIFLQICDGLSYAHSKGVLHRDIKPSNVILLEQPNDFHKVKLLDFGLAKATNNLDPKITKTGLAVGSPAYMSPEQALGKEIDERSDIYNFGCTLFQSLTGETVFGSENPTEILNKQVRDKPPRLCDKVDREFAPQVEGFVARCLSKNPQNRFSSVDEMKKTLTEVMDSLDMEVESESSINQSIYDESKLYYQILALSMVLVFLFGLGYFLYIYIERQNEVEAKKAPKVFKRVEKMPAEPIKLGDAITRSFGFKLKRDPEGVFYVDSSGQVTDGELEEAAQKFAREKVGFWNITHSPNFSGVGVRYLEGLKIKELRLTKSAITDKGCKAISRLKSLQSLSIDRCSFITPVGISYLSKLPNLKTLHVSNRELTNRTAFTQIAKIKSLNYLKVSRTKLGKEEVEPVSKALSLRRFYIAHSTMMKSAFASLSTMKSLRSIALVDTRFSSEGISKLAQSKIENIDIIGTRVDDSIIESLGKISTLRVLNFKSTNISEMDVRALNKLIPKCEVFVD